MYIFSLRPRSTHDVGVVGRVREGVVNKLCTLHEIVRTNQILQVADHIYEYNSIACVMAAIQCYAGPTVLATE